MNRPKFERFLQIKKDLLGSCKKCQGKGYIKNELCDCMKKFDYYLLLSEHGIEKEFWDLEFKDWKGDEVARSFAEKYVERIKNFLLEGIGLVFCGPNGTGKTMLMSVIFKEALKKNYSVHSITFSEILELLSWNSYPLLNTFKEKDFFGIDEFNLENSFSKFDPNLAFKFTSLVRFRRRNLLPTFVTTNLSELNFKKMIGSTLTSLFIATCKFVSVEGPDFRVEQSKKIDRVFEDQKKE